MFVNICNEISGAADMVCIPLIITDTSGTTPALGTWTAMLDTTLVIKYDSNVYSVFPGIVVIFLLHKGKARANV